MHVDTEFGHCVQKRAHGLKGFCTQGLLRTVPHAHAVFHPSASELIEVTLLGPMGNVGRFDGDVRDFVFAQMRIQDALRTQHPQPHIQVTRIGPKNRGHFIDVSSRLQSFLQHATHVEHWHDPTKARPSR